MNNEDTIILLEQAADTLWGAGYKGLARRLSDYADTLRPPLETKAPGPTPEEKALIDRHDAAHAVLFGQRIYGAGNGKTAVVEPTPRDLEDYLRREMRAEMDALREEATRRYNLLSAYLEHAANEMHKEMRTEIDALRTEMGNLKADDKVRTARSCPGPSPWSRT